MEHGGNVHKIQRERKIDTLVDFSANINPFGLNKKIKEEIINNIDGIVHYPDPDNYDLVGMIAEKHSVMRENILCGNGASDLIFRIVEAFRPEESLLIEPTFSEYRKALKRFSNINTIESIHYDLDLLSRIKNTDVTLNMIFVCNPNNPTGILAEDSFLEGIIDYAKKENITLIVDESFIDFTHSKSLISKYHNDIIILRSFTKMYAIAGLRLGYLVSSPEVIKKIKEISPTWQVSSLASAAGICAFHLEGFEEKTRSLIDKERDYLKSNLKKMGFEFYDSSANYICFKSHIEDLDSKLLDVGIAIRNCDNYIGLGENYYRIAVRSREDNTVLINSLLKLCKE
ncbi:MAG: threonine-phosphate decarboxylase [Clostridiales bacterium]|nr:MAG: threonine-phosphate decarboxylase [Clostridiales bacterium]